MDLKTANMFSVSGDGVSPRLARLSQIRIDVAHKLAHGRSVSMTQLVADHPELMPELGEELHLLELTHQQLLAVKRTSGLSHALLPDGGEPPLSVPGYQIISELGRGGQGIVFLANQMVTGRPVALKVVSGGVLLLQRRQARLEREVAILARLNHPNIVGVFDHGRTSDGSFFTAMDYIDGQHLDAWVDAKRKAIADPATFVRVVIQLFAKVADAAGEAHLCNIVHRDLKPSNIRVDARDEPHLLDFGLARQHTGAGTVAALSGVTQEGHVVGSLPWMSPEQATGANTAVGAASDVYSLGIMLHESLTGSPAYPREGTLVEVLSHVEQTVPARPSHVLPIVGAALDHIVSKALAKDPAARYPTAAELAVALRGYLADAPVHQRLPEVRNSRWRAAVLILAPLAGVATLAAWLWPTGSSTLPSQPSAAVVERLLLRPESDTFVRNGRYSGVALGGESGNNVEHYRMLEVKSEGPNGTRDAYLRFDISDIPPVAVIEHATLRVHGKAVAGKKFNRSSADYLQVSAHALQVPGAPWEEQTLKWPDRPHIVGFDKLSDALGYVEMPLDVPGWYELDLTSFFRAEQAERRTSTTIVLHCVSLADLLATFDSSEGPNPPQLVIQWRR